MEYGIDTGIHIWNMELILESIYGIWNPYMEYGIHMWSVELIWNPYMEWGINIE